MYMYVLIKRRALFKDKLRLLEVEGNGKILYSYEETVEKLIGLE